MSLPPTVCPTRTLFFLSIKLLYLATSLGTLCQRGGAGLADRMWGKQTEAGRPDPLGVWVGERAAVRLGSRQGFQSMFGGFRLIP